MTTTQFDNDITELVAIYREGQPYEAILADDPTNDEANRALGNIRRRFLDHLGVFAVQMAVRETGSNLPTTSAIKDAKARLFAAFNEAK